MPSSEASIQMVTDNVVYYEGLHEVAGTVRPANVSRVMRGPQGTAFGPQRISGA